MEKEIKLKPIKGTARGRKKGAPSYINRYKLYSYNFKSNRWQYIGDFTTIQSIADSLKMRYTQIQKVYTNSHRIMNRFLKITEIKPENKTDIKEK
jgi:hypothetical protein